MKTRIKNLQTLLQTKNLPALLVTNPYNVRYLTGFVGTNGSLLVTPKKHILITDARYFMTAQKAGVPYYDQAKGLKGLMGKLEKIGFEEGDMTVAQLKAYKKALPGLKWKATEGIVESLRIIKDETEIKLIKKAVKIACEVLNQLQKFLKPGRTEDEIEWELLKISRELGADGFSFPPIITFGKDTADIHHQKGTNKLKKGEMVLIDSGIIYQGYITDMTRVFFYKEAKNSEQEFYTNYEQNLCSLFEQKIYTKVLEANQKAIQSVAVGKTFGEIDRVAREVIENAGFGKHFTHSTGHGTGLEVHEAPTVSKKSKEKIQPGMVFTIEPGIYVEGKGGVRIEDMIYVNPKGGVEVLTTCLK